MHRGVPARTHVPGRAGSRLRLSPMLSLGLLGETHEYVRVNESLLMNTAPAFKVQQHSEAVDAGEMPVPAVQHLQTPLSMCMQPHSSSRGDGASSYPEIACRCGVAREGWALLDQALH
jgi:hypothetical protein